MKNLKILVIIMALILCMANILLISNYDKVVVSAGEDNGDNYNSNGRINLSYIWEQVLNLSEVIYKAYDPEIEIPKGRSFGSKGANYTIKEILRPQMENMDLEDVHTEQIQHINYPVEIKKNYTSIINMTDFQLTVNNDDYPYENPIPKKEMYVIPAGAASAHFNNLTHNYTLNNAEIIKNNMTDYWPFAGTFNNYYFTITNFAIENSFTPVIAGNMTYLDNQTNPSIDDQCGRVYLLDETDNIQNKIDNITRAEAAIIIDTYERGIPNMNTTKCEYSVLSINESDGTEIKELLENYIVLVDNVTGNLTFTYNLGVGDLPIGPHVYIDRIPDHYELWNITLISDPLLWTITQIVGGKANLDGYMTCVYLKTLGWQLINQCRPFSQCQGVILYDSYNYHFMLQKSPFWDEEPPDFWDVLCGMNFTEKMSYFGRRGPCMPVFTLNYIEGNWLNQHRGSTTLTGYADQKLTIETPDAPGLEAYNVIGNITIDQSPNDAIFILSNRYDGQWGQTPGDSGVGGAIVLGIAKYMKDYNIQPKYNLTILFTTGEENGWRGAYHYNDSHSNYNIKYWLGLEQLTFDQKDQPTFIYFLNPDHNNVLQAIINQTQYTNRTGYEIIANNSNGYGSEQFVYSGRNNCDTFCFVKGENYTWDHWHRAGENYEEGDSIKYIDRNDVNITAELVWNVTKYFCVDPDCWLTNVTFSAFDSDNDGDTLLDSIKANFTIHSIMPNDLVMIDFRHNVYDDPPFNNLYYMSTNYTVNNTSNRTEELVFSIPENMSTGNYSIFLRLYNSTGRINDIAGVGASNWNVTTSNSNIYKLYHPFGYIKTGKNYQNVSDRISGSFFTMNENGYADNITAFINRAYMSPGPYKCMLYRLNDSKLIATTSEDWSPRDYENPFHSLGWAVFNFSEPKPFLAKDTDYVITCWGENGYSTLYYDDFSYARGRFDNETYGDPPDTANFSDESKLYSIYCSYKTLGPEISLVSANPDVVGFGFDVNISANVIDNFTSVNFVEVNITYPDLSSENYTMSAITNISAYNYQYIFNDTWQHGVYNFTIWAFNSSGGRNSSTGHSFNVSVNAFIDVVTLKDNYSVDEFVNVTDPPNPLGDYYVVERGLTWDKYYNASSGMNTLVVSQGPVNYQDETGVWSPINCSLNMLDNSHVAYGYDYRVGNEQGLYNVYFKFNVQDSWPVVFAYNKSINPENYVVRTKLVGVGYLDPTNDWLYEILQSTQSSQGQIAVNSITYENVFTGTDVVWSYGNTGLKEEIIMSNTTKSLLQNHPPSDYGFSNQNSYLVFITRLDYSGLNIFNTSGVLTGDFTISDGGIDFKDALGNFKCALPLGEVYELYNNSVSKSLVYRFLQYNNNFYLLSGLKLVDLNSMSFPVVIDPTLTIESLNTDGYIYNSSSVYNTVWNASMGTISSSATYISIGQKKTGGFPSNYYIYRGFLIFNTTALPSNAYIDNATVSLYKKDDYSIKDFFLTIQNGQPDYPHNPLETIDYNKNNYSGNGGGFNTTSFANGRNNISLTNYSWLTREGFTKFCLRSSCDIDGTAPSKDEYVNVYSSDALGIDCYPKLIISYRNQSKIKNTGLRPIKGYLLMQVHFYNEQQFPAGWIVANDTINETTSRTINAMDQFGLDMVFNDLVNTSDLLDLFGRGLYRVYVAFRDPEGDVLQCDDDSLLETWYEFTIDI